MRIAQPAPQVLQEYRSHLKNLCANEDRRTTRSFYDASWTQKLSFDFVENSIDEFTAVLGREFFRNIDCFVDADDRRNVIPMKHFEDGQPQNIAIDRGNAMKIPILCVLLDQLIGFGPVLQCPFDE